jgi:hypothetical protein
MPHYMFCPRKKIMSWTLKISSTLIVNVALRHFLAKLGKIRLTDFVHFLYSDMNRVTDY